MSFEPSNTFQTTFLRKEKIASNVWSLYFSKPNNFEFVAGQFIDITLPLSNGNEKTYSFTVSSAPFEKDIVITTNDSESMFKHMLFGLFEGQKIVMRGPLGGFVFSEGNAKAYVFLSGGVGITPFRSIIVDAVHDGRRTPITLLASFGKKENIVFYDELKEIEEKNPQIKIAYTLTNEIASQFDQERISEVLIKKYISTFLESLFGIAGSGEMVDDMVALIRKMGVPNNYIRTDIFTGL